MKKIPYVILFSCGLFLTFAGSSFAAEPKPSWQATWEKTLAARIIGEMRAGRVVADLFSGGANTNYEVLYQGKALDSIKSALILPEVLDESKWYEGRHRYTDPEQRHIFVYIANPSSSGFYYNMTLVNPKEFKSYWDLVAPKWKGKYVSQDPLSTGLGGGLQFMYYHPELGPEFI